MSLWWAHFSFLNLFSGETLTCVLQLLNGGVSHHSPLPHSKLGAEAGEGRWAGELSTGRAVASEAASVHPLTLQFLLSVLEHFFPCLTLTWWPRSHSLRSSQKRMSSSLSCAMRTWPFLPTAPPPKPCAQFSAHFEGIALLAFGSPPPSFFRVQG